MAFSYEGKVLDAQTKTPLPAGNRRPGTAEPTTLGEEQGMVTLVIFP